MSCGGEHSLAVDKSGRVWSAGACGLGYTRLLEVVPALAQWQKVHALPQSARSAIGGYYHSLVLGAEGSVYAWGCGTFTDGNNDGSIPALGQPTISETTWPARVAGISDIVAVAAGAYHSVALSKSLEVWTWGAAQLGQLGRPTPIGLTDGAGLPVDSTPRRVALPEEPMSIGTAFYNTFVVCRSGAVYCCGENQMRQCGGGKDNLRAMTRVPFSAKIQKCVGGYCHTLALTRDGEVLTLGCGGEGQRAGPDCEDVSKVDGIPTKIIDIAAGANHSLALDETGVAWAFGSNEYGQLGVGDVANGEAVWKPMRVQHPKLGRRWVALSAGYAHSLFTDDSGSIYSCGTGANGALALASTQNPFIDVANPTLCFPHDAASRRRHTTDAIATTQR